MYGKGESERQGASTLENWKEESRKDMFGSIVTRSLSLSLSRWRDNLDVGAAVSSRNRSPTCVDARSEEERRGWLAGARPSTRLAFAKD